MDQRGFDFAVGTNRDTTIVENKINVMKATINIALFSIGNPD
jgi:hypothetical protein